MDSSFVVPSFILIGESFRGPGFYFSLVKIVILLVVYFCWISTCTWVERDAHQLELPKSRWNPILLGAGVLGLIVVWLLPFFWISILAFLILYGAAALSYAHVRNQRVPRPRQVLTPEHLRAVLSRVLHVKLPNKGSEEDEERIPVRFVGRGSDQQQEDPNRVARAEGSKGYRAALRMVHEAIERRVTDIHLEPTKGETLVRFRIDGMLHGADPFSRAMGDAVINIFKVLSNMDITEKRKPQDGSFSAEVEGRFVDFRVASAGSVVGEKLVMRVLDRSRQIASLTQLGMRDKMREQVHGLVTQPHGLFLVCGPTGAGKSTTLYACLNEIDRYQQNVITIENPVEYQLTNVTQIEVNARAGKTFASELRSILRQDPDVIMIGEIRDQETAEIACQAAQTGHMVFTTLHANDTITAIGRLIDLGVQPFMIASALTAVLGQRLVRVLCPRCKVRYKPNPDLLKRVNLPAEKIKHFYRPRENTAEGEEICEHCGGTGYYGRTGVFELLLIADSVRELIRDNPNLNTIKQTAVKSGMRYMHEDGLRQVIEGKTSIQELLRVSK